MMFLSNQLIDFHSLSQHCVLLQTLDQRCYDIPSHTCAHVPDELSRMTLDSSLLVGVIFPLSLKLSLAKLASRMSMSYLVQGQLCFRQSGAK